VARDRQSRRAAGSPSSLRTTLFAVALVLLASIPYLGSLGHPMLHDDRTLLDNRWLKEEAGPVSVFRHHYWHGSRHHDSDLYRPLTILSLAWNLEADGPRAVLRGTNLVLHLFTVLMVWRILLHVSRRLDAGREGNGAVGAFAGAALFAAHPLASEAVLFAVGRAELMAAALSMAAFLCLLNGTEGNRYRLGCLAVSPVLYFMALCSKESAASWIPVLAVFCLCLRIAGNPCRRVLAGSAGWVVSLGAFLVLRGSVVGWLTHTPPWVDNPLVSVGAVTRAANGILLHALYLGKMVWPSTLSVDHGFDQTRVLALFPWALAGALFVAAIWFCLAAAFKRTSVAALFLWMFVPAAFAVTGNLLFPIGTIFAERLAYLPLAGFCGLAGLLLARYVRGGTLTAVILVIVLVFAVGRTAVRTTDLKDHTTFVEATASDSPRAVKALMNAGRSRLRRGDTRGAVELLERAVEIWPEYRRALGVLGDAYERLGEREKAREVRSRAKKGDMQLSP
jgi:hypothetical protein